jgi:hypothetical protein
LLAYPNLQKCTLVAIKLPKKPNKFIAVENTAIFIPIGASTDSIAFLCKA